MVLTIRTDKPEAELGLYEDGKKLAYITWQADRNLSAGIHKRIDELFARRKITYFDLSGIILYKGPGSFTGLRIGASVANTLASELDIPIAGANSDDWISKGLLFLEPAKENRLVVPEYGSEPKTTKPKK
jgi:tRNA threonylcarbamoyladenosine biosynthesis protein TsaB